MLENKKILLGITGSIAAYKAAILVRLLIKAKAEVKVIMTPYAKEFITPLTLSSLSKNPVYSDFFNRDYGTWHSHISLAEWADLFLIAPATANTLGKMANAIADNLLLTTYLSARCPVIIAPAMDLDMYKHPSNQKNIEILKSYGNLIIEPASGELASGLEGKGRMEEPEEIMEIIKKYLQNRDDRVKKKLSNTKFMVTAGPTYEMIDPVRFIGNFSSGKMGYAIAHELAENGAEVILIAGPNQLSINHKNIQLIKVTTADEMHRACVSSFTKEFTGAIFSAAVSDFAPSSLSKEKIKQKEHLTIELVPTKDIASEIGKLKTPNQITVGFALETENAENNAIAKLKQKYFDFIVLNSLKDQGAGFNLDTNKITIIDKNLNCTSFNLKSKSGVAADIVNKLTGII